MDTNKMVRLGHALPGDLTNDLETAANETIFDYLTKTQAPQNLIDLVGEAVILARFNVYKRTGSFTDTMARDLIEMLPETAINILDLGGELKGL